jgi:hypothetical protein
MKALRHLVSSFSVAAMLGSVLSAPAAYALDAKVYPGMMCAPTNGFSYDSVRVFGGRLYNISTQTISIACPIVRDHTTGAWNSIEIVAVDQHSTDNVACWGVSANRDGYTTVISQIKSTAGDAAAGQVLTLPSISDTDKGYFYLQCNVPPSEFGQGSGVASYYVVEP